jgi:hypothetical protein
MLLPLAVHRSVLLVSTERRKRAQRRPGAFLCYFAFLLLFIVLRLHLLLLALQQLTMK